MLGSMGEWSDGVDFQLADLRRRIAKLETADGGGGSGQSPASSTPPLSLPWLVVENGVFKKGCGGPEFRAWSVNVVAYAITHSTEDQLKGFLDRCASSGITLLRVLHWAIDETGGYIPTYADCDKYLPKLINFVRLCKERDIRVWLTCHHRHRLTQEESPSLLATEMLWANRPAGITKGEISDLFLWDDGLEGVVRRTAVALAKVFSGDPTVSLITIANEKCAVRSRLYFPKDRGSTTLSAYAKRWFEKLDQYLEVTGLDDRDMNRPAIERFHAWVGYTAYRRLYKALRDEAGVKCPINATSVFGDTKMSGLIEQMAGDFIDFHIYPENDQIPDPVSPLSNASESRTFGSTAAALHLEDYPLTCSEWGSVYQQGPQAKSVSVSRLTGPAFVAGHCSVQGVSVACQYAAHSHPIGGPTAKNESYDSFRDHDFEDVFTRARPEFMRAAQAPEASPMLTEAELFGSGVGPQFSIPQPGTQSWAVDAAVSSGQRLTVLPVPFWVNANGQEAS